MHNNTEIEKLFYNFDKLTEELTDSSEVREAHKKAMDFLKEHKMPQKIELQVDDLLCGINYAGEKQGFCTGF
ncbi:MAG: hypothetical protein KH330_08595 [Clostridiales bacterium]|nr:hypothetical protein [Clostridiales bacterium]